MANNIFHHELIYRGQKVLDSFTKPILVCGCGTIGSNLIDNLVRQGFTNIGVIDKDRVELHNINTQIWKKQDVGATKVNQMYNHAFDVAGVVLDVESKELTLKNVKKLTKEFDLVVDAFDNTAARRLLKDNCKNCIHAGLYEDYAEVYWNDSYTVPQDGGKDICDYPLARNITMLLNAVLTEEIIKFCCGEKLSNWNITLKDLKITRV